MNFSGYQGNMNPMVEAQIPHTNTQSNIISTGGLSLCGILMPAAFTGTAITFQMSIDGINFYPVYSTTSGTVLTYTVAASTYAAIDPVPFYGVSYLKLQSSNIQAALRVFNLALKGI